VFTTPVYYSDLSESLRASWMACAGPVPTRTVKSDREKPVIGVCVAGGGGGGAPGLLCQPGKGISTCGFSVLTWLPFAARIWRRNCRHWNGTGAN